MQRICSLIYLTLFWAGAMSVMVLVSQDQVMTVSLGESATFRCSMEGDTVSNYYISWYRKTQGNAMTFLHREGGTFDPNLSNKFRANIDQSNNQAVLKLLKATQSDEGIYYCASEYVIGSSAGLNFAKGTHLEVQPKRQPPAKPSVFIMRNGTNVACLVKDFYPKNVTISLQSSKKIMEFDPTIVVSPSGKYSAVKLGQYEDSNAVTCSVEHNNKIVYSTDFEQMQTSSDNLKLTEPENKKQTSKTCHELKVHAGKVNMISLTVLGLRMLFAKTVALNFLLTAKLFFY